MAGTMILTEARSTVASGALHVAEASGQYSNTNIDRAIRWVGNDWCDYTQSVRSRLSISLLTGSHIIDITATYGQWLEPQFIQANIDGFPVKLDALHSVQRKFRRTTTRLGRPSRIALEGPTRAWIYPEPNVASTLEILRWESFTPFTVGTGTPGAVTLNIQDQHIDQVLRFGAATALVYADPDSLYTSQGFQRYLEFREKIAEQYIHHPATPTPSDPSYAHALRPSPAAFEPAPRQGKEFRTRV